MKRYFIFTEHPTKKINVVRETKKERDEVIKNFKSLYPTIPVYWQEVREG